MADRPGPPPVPQSEQPGENDSQARERRLHALRELAREQAAAATDSPAPNATPPAPALPRRARAGWWAALAVVALGAGLATYVFTRGAPPAAPRGQPRSSVTTIVPRAQRLGCVEDVAWAPDGSKVAVLGYSQCPGAASAGLINIYNVTTGQLIQQLHPDDTLAQIHGIASQLVPHPSTTPAPGQLAPYIQYQALMWSPDGARLAVPFFVEQSFYAPRTPYLPSVPGTGAPPSTPTTAGVLLTDIAGTNPHAITAPYQQTDARLEWDLARGQLIAPALALPPALGYRWGEHGALVPQTPLGGPNPPTAAPLGPVGNPNGDAAFTVWQPGQAAPGMTTGSAGLAAVPNLYVWFSSFGAWSPDGRYLVTPAFAADQISLPGHPAADARAVGAAGFAGTPTLPARDAALSHLYAAMTPADANGDPPSARFVAWRPNGRILAAAEEPLFSESRAAQLATHTTVVLYDALSGRTVSTLTVPSHLAAALNSARAAQYVWLSWSPDGTRLLFLDAPIGTLSIWSPEALPH